MDELLQEFVDSRGIDIRVDREHGVLRGVKLLGLESRNSRKYSPAALDAARGLYEGARVNVNHPKGHPLAPRDYQDRLGLVRSIALRPGAGLFGDFHFNPKHALAEQLLWDAEHTPENVGFSHNVQARTVRQGDETLVEAILKVHSVDLVADPATTCGLFEQAQSAAGPTSATLAECTLDDLRRLRPDLTHQIEEQSRAELATLRNRVDEFEASSVLRSKRELARRLLAEFHLPDPDQGSALVSESFLNTLFAAADERAMRDLVIARARLVEAAIRQPQAGANGKPHSREQGFGSSELDPASVEDFVRAIRGTPAPPSAADLGAINDGLIAAAASGRFRPPGDYEFSLLASSILKTNPKRTDNLPRFLVENLTMTDTMRWRYGDTNPVVTKPIASTATIQIGDLVMQDSSGNVTSAGTLAWTTDLPTTQGAFHTSFLGVAMQRSLPGDTDPISVATSGVFEMACTSATFNIGDLVAPAQGTGNVLQNQAVVGVAASDEHQAIGRVANYVNPANIEVLVSIVSTIQFGGVQASA